MEIPYVYTNVRYVWLLSVKYFMGFVGFEKSSAKYSASKRPVNNIS